MPDLSKVLVTVCKYCGKATVAPQKLTCDHSNEWPATKKTTEGWPPNFRCLEDGPGRWVVVNENFYEEYASVVADPAAAREAAWDWWRDVKDQPRGN